MYKYRVIENGFNQFVLQRKHPGQDFWVIADGGYHSENLEEALEHMKLRRKEEEILRVYE